MLCCVNPELHDTPYLPSTVPTINLSKTKMRTSLAATISLLLCLLEQGEGFQSSGALARPVGIGFQPTVSSAGMPTRSNSEPLTCLASNKVKEREATSSLLEGKGVNGHHQVNGKEQNTGSHNPAPPSSILNDVNGDKNGAKTDSDHSDSVTNGASSSSTMVKVEDLIAEIDRRVSDGSTEIMESLTSGIDEKLNQLPDAAAMEFSTYLSDMAKQVQKAQQEELQRQLSAMEARFARPFEELAFSDAPLFEKKAAVASSKDDIIDADVVDRDSLILTGVNSTLPQTRRLRTREILKNFNVAPFYYSIALALRWARKASTPSIYLLSIFKSFASVIKSAPKRNKKNDSYEDFLKDAADMQAGWKRTGEIAAKGPMARKWAILRRSAEIWAYFSSFYLKDRRITKKFQSGKWDEERYSQEKSKLGAEVVQNLLKLGPTFIKVNRTTAIAIILFYFFQSRIMHWLISIYDVSYFLLPFEISLGGSTILYENRYRAERVH